LVSKMRQLSRRTLVSNAAPAHHDTACAAALINGLAEASPAPDRLAYTIDEFCRAVTIGQSLAYAEIAAGRLKVVRVGRRTLVPVDSAKAWLASLPEGVGGEPAAPRRARLARRRVDGLRQTDCDEQLTIPSGHLRSCGSDALGSKGARPKNSLVSASQNASASS
jgi:hypothetical protein